MHIRSGHPTALDTLTAPVTVLVGHFGAGKSEIAVNLAFGWRERGEAVAVVDLDLVKPYFRSRLVRDEMQARGITLVVPQDDRFYADLPIVVPEVRGAVGRAVAGQGRAILDVGGADVGSRVLGSLAGLDDPALADVLFVVNGNRPFAETPDAVIAHAARHRAGVEAQGDRPRGQHAPDRRDHRRHGDRRARTRARGVARHGPAAAVLGDARAPGRRTRRRSARLPWLPLTRQITTPLDPRPHGMRRRSSLV